MVPFPPFPSLSRPPLQPCPFSSFTFLCFPLPAFQATFAGLLGPSYLHEFQNSVRSTAWHKAHMWPLCYSYAMFSSMAVAWIAQQPKLYFRLLHDGRTLSIRVVRSHISTITKVKIPAILKRSWALLAGAYRVWICLLDGRKSRNPYNTNTTCQVEYFAASG
jgi:hypothetical protein